MTNRVSIAVVDDHPIFRLGVIRVLRSEPNFEVVAEGTCASDAVEIATTMKPDVMLLDMSMPGGGLNAARTIAEETPDTKVVFLTMVDDDTVVASALKAGARGYVLKGVSAPELIRTIWTTQHGEAYVSPELAARMLAAIDGEMPEMAMQAGPLLSEVDRRILSLVMGGRSPEQIAGQLRLDASAVRLRLASAVALLNATVGGEGALASKPDIASGLH